MDILLTTLEPVCVDDYKESQQESIDSMKLVTVAFVNDRWIGTVNVDAATNTKDMR